MSREILMEPAGSMTEFGAEAIFRDAHSAVTDPPIEAGEAGGQAERSRFGDLSRYIKTGLAIGAAALAASGPAAEKASASGQNTQITSLNTDLSVQIAGSTASDSDISSGRVQIRSYIRANGLPKRYITKKNCYWDRNGGYNSGARINSPTRPRRVSDVDWFRDNRDTYVCRVPRSLSPTGLAKAICGNFWMDKKPKKTIPPPIMVRNRATAEIDLHANSNAEARAECRSADGLASAWAYGRGSGHATTRLRLKAYLTAIGRGRAVGRISADAEGEASSRATADAGARCESRPIFPPPPPPPNNQPQNRPPSGVMNPDQHIDGVGKVCVDDIRDPENDRVDAYNFRVYRADDPQKRGIGEWRSEVYPQPGGAQCRDIYIPPTSQSYRAATDAWLTDGRNNIGLAPAEFDVPADDFGSY